MHSNHLGSTAFVTDETGATIQKTIYYPWGQTWQSSATVKDSRFASMDPRDNETANDPTLFRMYQPRLYRWMSPDPLAGDISNPQSLNRYAYVLNNPTSLVDPLGLGQCPPGTSQSGPGQCVGSASSGFFAYPNGGVGASGGPTICAVDGIVTNCGELANNLHGSTTMLFVAAVGAAAAASRASGGAVNLQIGEETVCLNGSCETTAIMRWFPVSGGGSFCSSNGCLSLLKGLGNFSSGAADVLTFGGTYLVQRAQGTNSVVNRNGGTYYVGVATGTAMQAAFAATGAALANGKNGALFGRGLSTLFNSSYIRFGWYWAGPAIGGQEVVGLRIGPPRTGIHIPFLYP